MNSRDRTCRVLLALLVFVGVPSIAADKQGPPSITIQMVPPEPIPGGTCTESRRGYVGLVGNSAADDAKLTQQQVGEYVQKRLSEGYSLTLYPQNGGRIYAIAKCELPQITVVPRP